MEYLNDYNDNAKTTKIKFVFEVYVKSLFSWKCEHKCGLEDF